MNLSDNAEIIFRKRFAFDDKEDWQGLSERVSNTITSCESDPKYLDLFSEIIYNMKFIPAGRILRNCGRPKGSLLNCFVISPTDDISGIGQYMKDALVTWSEGAGVGTNFSSLRPEGSPIISKGGESSGMCSFLMAADGLASTIESGGQRRAAGLALCSVEHPEVLKFIDLKMKDKILRHFNISVGVTNEFLDAVETDSKWEFTFNHRLYGSMPARKLWDKILENMVASAEPGILNIDNIRSNNSYYFAPVTSTNPCGEATLENYGACDLGALVLPKFITESGRTNWKELERVIKLAVRFLDNVLDVNRFTLERTRKAAYNGRRIGLGFMGIAEYLFSKKLRYGSPESLRAIERLIKFKRDIEYSASIELAIEKGAFHKFDSVQYSKSHFVRTLPPSIRKDIKRHGIRNVTLAAVAPTGSISLLTQCTGGIEPVFSLAYRRDDKISSRVYIHPEYCKATEENNPGWLVDSRSIKPTDHLEVQSIVQKYTDCSISKTINLAGETKPEDVSELFLEYIRDLKGLTVYRDGCRGEQPLNHLNEDEIKKYLRTDNNYDTITDLNSGCKDGKCDI